MDQQSVCKQCGSSIASDAAFCPQCGAPVSAQPQAADPAVQQAQAPQPNQPVYQQPQQAQAPQPNHPVYQQAPPAQAPQPGHPVYQQAPPAQAPQPGQPVYQQPQPAQAPQPGYQPPNPGVPQQKSRMAAGLLGIFLGWLGIHNFYLGYTNKALVQLLVSVCTCFIAAVGMWIWGLVEGIQILTGSINVDANNIPLSD